MTTRAEFFASLEPAEVSSNQSNECPICNDPLEDPVSISCNSAAHVFCRECLIHWCQGASHNTCPLCRRVLFMLDEGEVEEAELDRLMEQFGFPNPLDAMFALDALERQNQAPDGIMNGERLFPSVQYNTPEWQRDVLAAARLSGLIDLPRFGRFREETFGLGRFSNAAIREATSSVITYLMGLREPTDEQQDMVRQGPHEDIYLRHPATVVISQEGTPRVVHGPGVIHVRRLLPRFIALAHLFPYLDPQHRFSRLFDEDLHSEWRLAMASLGSLVRRHGMIRSTETHANFARLLGSMASHGFRTLGERDAVFLPTFRDPSRIQRTWQAHALCRFLEFIAYTAWEEQQNGQPRSFTTIVRGLLSRSRD